MTTGIRHLDAVLSPPPVGGRRQQVVVIGGGFAGLRAVRALRDAPVDVTLIDRRNFHLFQPLLYQVATGALSSTEISAPLRGVLKRQQNARVILAEVRDVDLARRRVLLSPLEGVGAAIPCPYDALVVAAGSRHAYFGHDEWEPLAPGLKTVEDALELRRRILLAFEAAERADDPRTQAEWLTFAVVGAGPTGVEMAGQIVEMARDTLRRDFRRIDPINARVMLIEAAPTVLAGFDEVLRAAAARDLREHGVELLLERTVVEMSLTCVSVRNPHGNVERIPARTVVWGAGVKASPLGATLAAQSSTEPDRAGRLPVNPNLTLPDHPEVFVVGDMALLQGPDGRPLPGVAPVAMQQGEYAGRVIAARATGRREPRAFRYRDRGTLATIGRAQAVGTVYGVRLRGFDAWLAWLLVHLTYLIGFQNRLFVLLRWSFSFLTRGRGARIITEPSAAPVPVRSQEEPADRNGGPAVGERVSRPPSGDDSRARPAVPVVPGEGPL